MREQTFLITDNFPFFHEARDVFSDPESFKKF